MIGKLNGSSAKKQIKKNFNLDLQVSCSTLQKQSPGEVL